MPSSKTNQLRQKAEKLLQERGQVENFRKYAHNLERLIEELNVYQIEMDLQNEELRKSEENHRIEKEKYNDLFEFSPESIISLDKNLRITNSNLATVDLLKLERSRLLSQPLSRFVHPDKQDEFYRSLKSLIEKKADASMEVDLLNHHNQQIHVRIRARHLDDVHYGDRIMIVITDISQLKKTQLDLENKNKEILKQNRKLDKQNHEFQAINEELRQTNEELEELNVKLQKSEKRYRLLFEESTDPSLMLQGDQFVEANQAALDFLGYKDHEEIIGKTPWEVSPPKQADGEDSQKKAKAYIRDAIRKGYQRFEWLHTDKNNKERWIDVSLTYLPTAPDQSIYTIWRDITEVKKSEEVIQEKNEEIATQNEELQTQNEELAERNQMILKTNRQLEAERNRAQHYLDVAGVMFVAINQEGIVTLANRKATEILGCSENEILGRNWFDGFLPKENISKIKDVFNYIMNGKLEQLEYVENFIVSRNGEKRMIAWHNSLLQGENGEITGTLSSGEDITEKHLAEKELKKIEWLLKPKSKKKEPQIPVYGDLRKLNTQPTILEAVGEKMLNEIVSDYLDLLETSAAIYEKNGDYAVGIFSSEWCSFMDEASRNLCKGCNNKEALDSGKWHCHESCWKDASLQCMEKQKAVDIECAGGLNLYAIPIFANKKVIGAINFGYGDPPKDDAELKKIAEKYQVSFERLKEKSEKYETRPAFIIDVAKERLATSAQLIGEIVERKKIEDALENSKKELEQIFNAIPLALVYTNKKRKIQKVNPAFEKIFGYDPEEVLGKTTKIIYANKDDYDKLGKTRYNPNAGKKEDPYEIMYQRKNGEVFPSETIGTPVTDANDNLVGMFGLISDITQRKQNEKALRESEERFRNIIESTPMGTLTYELRENDRLVFTGYNEAGNAMLETDCSRFIGKTIEEAFPGLVETKVPEIYREIARKGESWFTDQIDYNHEGIKGAYEVYVFQTSPMNIAVMFLEITEKLEAQKQTIKSEERFNLAMNAANDGLYDWNLETNEIYYSPRWKGMLGYAQDELEDSFSVWETLTDPEDAEKSWEMLKEHLAGKRDRFEMEFKMKHKDGHWVDILSKAEAVFDENGKAIRVVGMHTDISERKKAEQEIKESEEKFRTLVEQEADALLFHDLKGNLINVNQAAVDQYKYSRSELLNMKVRDLDPDYDERDSRGRFFEEMEFGKPRRFEARQKRKTGEIFPAEVTITKLKLHDKSYIMGLCRDISKEKAAKEALVESEEKLRNIIEHSTNMFYSHTTDHKLTYVSPQVEDILGYTPKEIPEVWMDIATENPANEKGYNLTMRAIEKAKPQPTYELELRHKNGKKVWVEVHEAPLVKNGKTIAIVGGLTDITKRKLATMALAESEELYKSLVIASPDAITFSNLRGEIEFVSPNMENILKTNQEKIIGTHLNDWIDDRDQDFAKRNVSSIMKGEFLGINRYHMKTAKNNAFIGEVVSSAVKSHEGEVIGMVSILRDVTKDIEIRNELDKHRQHLEDLVKERTAEIEDKRKEVERMNKLFVGREIRIKELREKVKELEKKLQE